MADEAEAAKTDEPKKPEGPKKVDIRDLTDEGAAKTKEMRFTKRIYVKYVGDDGELLEGEFTLTRPNLGGQSRMGVIAAELRQDKPAHALDRATYALHEWIATCQVVVTKAPPWWNTEELFDEELLQRVYLEALAFIRSFRKRVVE